MLDVYIFLDSYTYVLESEAPFPYLNISVVHSDPKS